MSCGFFAAKVTDSGVNIKVKQAVSYANVECTIPQCSLLYVVQVLGRRYWDIRDVKQTIN